jgi:DNA-binding LacI/PurR family transcriptional regulator
LFFEEGPDTALLNPFYLSLVGPMVRRCAAHGYDLLISIQQLSSDWHVDYEDSRKADGIILLGYGDYLEYRPKLEQLVDRGAHFVRWGSGGEGRLGTTISSDNERGGFEAATHLLQRGRRRIAFIGTAGPGFPEVQERWRGYSRALRAAGIEPDERLQVDAAPDESDGRAAAEQLLAREIDFDAIFAASDVAAIGAMHALQQAGRSVPEVAIVGFDDIPAACLASPPLTTVTQDVRAAAEALVDALIEAIETGKTADQVLPVRLTVRGSS